MTFYNTFTAKLRSLLRKEQVRHRPLLYPIREWGVCLLVTMVIAIGLIGYAALEFHAQLNDRNAPVLAEEQIVRYRGGEAESIIRYYEGKERAFNALREDRPVQIIPATEEMATEQSEPVAEGEDF